jgi:hypothetical protein
MRTANSVPWLARKIAIAAPLGEEPWVEAMRYANPTIGGVQGCGHSQAAVCKLWQRIEVKEKASRRRQHDNAPTGPRRLAIPPKYHDSAPGHSRIGSSHPAEAAHTRRVTICCGSRPAMLSGPIMQS